MRIKTQCNCYTNFDIRKTNTRQAKDLFYYGILLVKYPLLMFRKSKF